MTPAMFFEPGRGGLILDVGIGIGSSVGFHLNLFRLREDMLLRLLLVKVALDCVQDTVDELSGLVRRKPAGNFQSFVDCYRAGCGFVKELIDSKSENIAVDDRHT